MNRPNYSDFLAPYPIIITDDFTIKIEMDSNQLFKLNDELYDYTIIHNIV